MKKPPQSIKDFESLSTDAPQDVIQERLDAVGNDCGIGMVMESLFQWELKSGYISREKLEGKETHRFHDRETGIEFRLQVNFARSRYTPKPVMDTSLPPVHCALCRENVGRPGKENLRVYEFPLGGEAFFLQLTPFPLFPYHFVVILLAPEPQNIDRKAMKWIFDFSEIAPAYTVCSNSDVAWAGSSILEHHHFQVVKDLHLPVMSANPIAEFGHKLRGCTVDLLEYPMAAVRVRGKNGSEVEEIASRLVLAWKRLKPGKNTVNLVLYREHGRENGQYVLFIFFRNPAYRTPRALTKYKTEGVGVIEAGGEAMLPIPENQELWKVVRTDGLSIVKGILEGNSPFRKKERNRINNFIRRSL